LRCSQAPPGYHLIDELDVGDRSKPPGAGISASPSLDRAWASLPPSQQAVMSRFILAERILKAAAQ
jgi:hypothetical protein